MFEASPLEFVSILSVLKQICCDSIFDTKVDNRVIKIKNKVKFSRSKCSFWIISLENPQLLFNVSIGVSREDAELYGLLENIFINEEFCVEVVFVVSLTAIGYEAVPAMALHACPLNPEARGS